MSMVPSQKVISDKEFNVREVEVLLCDVLKEKERVNKLLTLLIIL